MPWGKMGYTLGLNGLVPEAKWFGPGAKWVVPWGKMGYALGKMGYTLGQNGMCPGAKWVGS